MRCVVFGGIGRESVTNTIQLIIMSCETIDFNLYCQPLIRLRDSTESQNWLIDKALSSIMITSDHTHLDDLGKIAIA